MTGITPQTGIRPLDTTDYFWAALAKQTEIKELEERLKMLRGDLDYQIGKINELGLSSKIARVTGCRVIRKINAAWVRDNRPDLYDRYVKVSAPNVVKILAGLSGGNARYIVSLEQWHGMLLTTRLRSHWGILLRTTLSRSTRPAGWIGSHRQPKNLGYS